MKYIQLFIFSFVVIALSFGHAYSQPTYAVCAKFSQYAAVEKAGYDYLEPTVGDFLMPAKSDSAFAAQLDTFNKLNATLISCTIFLPGELKVVGPAPKHAEILVWAETVFRRAQKAGIPYIVFGSGGARRVPDNFDKKEAIQQFITLCKKLAPLAEAYGVTVVVEPLNTKESNMINSLAEGVEIVAAVNHPSIQLLCDIYHMLQENEPPVEIIKYGKYIRHCHIAEKGTRAAPGTDGFDFVPYFEALKAIQYEGCISIEGNWDNFETRLVPALQYMQQQYFSLSTN